MYDFGISQLLEFLSSIFRVDMFMSEAQPLPSPFRANVPGVGQVDRTTMAGWAHAAAGAYINTCARICGLTRPAPIYQEAVDFLTAHFSGEHAAVDEAIACLEEQCHCGVCWAKQMEEPDLPEFLQMSIIVSFTTSDPAGWDDIDGGDLLKRPDGDEDTTWDAFLVDGYDLIDGHFVANNSWGIQSGNRGQVRFRFEAFHKFVVTKVFFTADSIRGKTDGTYREVIVVLPDGRLDGKEIGCAKVNLMAALYSSDWICDRHSSSSKNFPLLFTGDARGFGGLPPGALQDMEAKYVAYDLRQYVGVKLKKAVAAMAARAGALSRTALRLTGAGRLSVQEGEGDGGSEDEGEEYSVESCTFCAKSRPHSCTTFPGSNPL
jgi:hypothetical protein